MESKEELAYLRTRPREQMVRIDAPGYLAQPVVNHKQAVDQVEQETSIKVIGIGIGDSCDQFPTTYRHHLRVPDTTKLPRELGNLLMDELMEAE